METPESNFDPNRTQPPAPKTGRGLGLVLVFLAALAAAAYFFYRQSAPEQVVTAPQIPAPTTDTEEPAEARPAPPTAATETSAPDQPVPMPDEPPQPPLPALADSDEYLRKHWQDFGLPETIAPWAEGEFIFQRLVAFIDGLSRGEILQKLVPLNKTRELRPESIFTTTKAEGSEWLDEANFRRYSGFVGFITALDSEHLARLVHWFSPLLESAFQQLGQQPEQFSARLYKGIDVMLETPEIEGAIALKRESVYYQFAEPHLEALPNSQKLLLRMGPDNRQQVKRWLEAFKQALEATGSASTEP